MFAVLAHRVYARLFAAQVVALVGTGLMTVALGLLAYDLAGDRAGAVLGTALAIKMVAYVGLSPVAAALAERLPRKAVLIGADLIRAAVALALPFIDAVWQVYALIFVLQAASASFTPAFQAVIPDILPEERDYTRALSLSRLAYDLESLLSPALAGVLLLVISYQGLFAGTVLGFLGSALLVAGTALPARAGAEARRGFGDRLTRGVRIYLATPRLRGLLALNLTAAAAGAFVIVNTVVIVRAGYGLGEAEVAVALAAFGGGSMLAALALPRLLDTLPDRGVMLAAAAGLAALSLGLAAAMLGTGPLPWAVLLAGWAGMGLAYSAILTPSGRLLRRSSHAEDRPALFAAQFALSHACWLVTYPLAGWAGGLLGMGGTLLVLGGVGAGGVVAALRLWPAGDPQEVAHDHPDLPGDHPHLRDHGGRRHRHVFVIDDEHRSWPTHG
ncbi:MFS transporter [Roseicyclus persicicus]|uniref:MFS transporter n=1 Tax=Roseicyclus persicicus TaxID=2650661 RepID=A0A7X6GW25_9RHOB|nr:MFS transporter [Roseibacterium persicicum]NKX43445.1 MFS transporter [Roseibacterium persicicum]